MNAKNELYKIIKANLSIIFEDLELTENMELIKDLNYDSITLMQLILDVESEFNIKFDDEMQYEDIGTIRKLVSYIELKVSEKENEVTSKND